MSTDDDSSTDGGTGSGTSVFQMIVPNFVRKRFALKFLIVLLLMGVTIGAIGAVGTAEISSQTEERIEGEYRNQAFQKANVVNQWLESNRMSTRLASNEAIWTGTDSDEMSDGLRNRRQNVMSGDVSGMHLINRTADGSYVVASGSVGEGTEVSSSKRGWFVQRSFSGPNDVEVSSVYEAGGGDAVGFASPVAGTENRFLLVEVQTDSITGQLESDDQESGTFTQVVNATGTVMMDERASDPEVDANDALDSYGDLNTVNEALSLTDASSGVIARHPANDKVMDEEYAVGYAPILISGGSEDWVVLVHAPTSAVFGYAQQVSLYGMIATGGAVLIMGILGSILGYRTSSAIDRLTRKAEQMEAGDLDVSIHSDRIDNIGRLYDAFADMRDSLKRQIDEAERARKEAEVSRAEAMEMNNYLQEKADEFSRAMEATAAGDMTQRMETEGENEAMDRIASEFNEMIGELEKTTGQLKSFADEVAESGDVVLSSSESVRDASEQVAESIQKISDDAYDQKDRLQDVSEDLDDLVEALEQVESDNPSVDFGDSIDQFRHVATAIQEAADTSEGMMAETENVAGAAEEQAAELNEVSSRAEKLKRYARPLGDILNRFETEAEHEFVFSGGPSQTTQTDEDD